MPVPPNSMQSSKLAASHKTSSRPSSRGVRTCILHMCPNLDPGDYARETVDLAVQTQRSGWRALIASAGGKFVTEAERAAVRHTRMPLDRQGMLTSWRNRVHLEALVQSEHPALLHVHGIDTLPAAIGLSRSHRIPIVLDLTQPLPDDPRTHKLMQSLTGMDCAIRVPSEYMGNHLLDKFKIAPEQIHHIPPGIDLNIYRADAISPERLQTLSKLWRLPEHAGVILMPLPLRPGMGHALFLQALRQMKNENIYAVMVGSDPDAAELRTSIEGLINEYELDGKVIMPECTTDLPAACWLASTVIAPNVEPRGQHLELLAAQAIGRPVIVTDTGANPEMVLTGETAWVIAPNDVKALADALREAVNLNTNQRLNLTESTRMFIANTYPQVSWVTSMLELYDSFVRPTVRKTSQQAA
jgi:glycosyltransferase involved in cell wall biosynthesis